MPPKARFAYQAAHYALRVGNATFGHQVTTKSWRPDETPLIGAPTLADDRWHEPSKGSYKDLAASVLLAADREKGDPKMG